MPYAGHTLQPREIAAESKRYWSNYQLTEAVATALGESSGSLGAWHDNIPGVHKFNHNGQIMTIGQLSISSEPPAPGTTSRDCGLFQINIPDSQIGTPDEDMLRTESFDASIYEPVLHHNVDRAHALFASRHWQPWVAYTTGWATFPEFWVWEQDANHQPTNRWVKTGRYIQRAICGQMNFHIVILKDWNADMALYYGVRYAKHFGVKAPLQVKAPKSGPPIVSFQVPPEPAEPPADGVGPRPIPNNGSSV